MRAGDTKVPVFKVCAWAYRDALRALLAMPLMFVVALLVCFVESAAVAYIQYESGLLTLIVSSTAAIIVSLLLTPFLIAVHRFILLGENSNGYRIDLHSPRFWKFFVYSALLVVLLQGAIFSDMIFRSATAKALLPLCLLVGFLVVSVRVVLLFPAIAVDQAAARWENAVAASQGSFWRIAAVCVLVMLPLLLFTIVWTAFNYDQATETIADPQGWGIVLFIGLANFFIRTLLVAAASHLFRGLGDRLRDDSNPASSLVGS